MDPRWLELFSQLPGPLALQREWRAVAGGLSDRRSGRKARPRSQLRGSAWIARWFGRSRATMQDVEQHRLLVHAGWDGRNIFQDLWQFDTELLSASLQRWPRNLDGRIGWRARGCWFWLKGIATVLVGGLKTADFNSIRLNMEVQTRHRILRLAALKCRWPLSTLRPRVALGQDAAKALGAWGRQRRARLRRALEMSSR